MASKIFSVRAEEENIEMFDKLAAENKLTKTELQSTTIAAVAEKL